MHIISEHYHVYNRGAHKAPIFLDGNDYQRFIALLHVANDTQALRPRWSEKDIWTAHNKTRLVKIFAYCLMPNHFHLGLTEIVECGIEDFMRRLSTAYVMYYNKKYQHSGTIFQGDCKSKLIDSDEYLRYVIEYIHLNPYGIQEPHLMKTAKPEHLKEAIEFSKKYEFSSFKDYLAENRPQRMILTL